MQCPSCGNRLPEGASSCPACGARIGESSTSPSPTPDLRPLGIGEIVDVGIKIYLRHFKTLVIAVAVVAVPLQVVASLVSVSLPQAEDFADMVGPAAGQIPDFDARRIGAFAIGMLVIGVIGLISTQLATGASFKAVSDAYLGQVPDWRTSLRFAVDRLRPLVWLAVLVMLIVFGGIIALAAVVGLIMVAASAAGSAVFGLLVLVVPAAAAALVYLVVAWSVAVPALLLEDKRGTAALGRSRQLVAGAFWTTAAVLLLSIIIRGIVSMVIGGVFGIGFATVGDTLIGQFLLEMVIGVGGSVLTTPFAAAIVAVLYFDLRVRREGFDLELLAGGMGDGPQDPEPAAGDPWNPFSPPEPTDAPPPPATRKPPGPDGPTWESR